MDSTRPTCTASFIIPHKGREAMLIETLESIAAQRCDTLTYEVIVVSQNASASEAIEAFKSRMPLTVLFNKEGNTISHSRNLGAHHAVGEYLAFLDADVRLAPNWLETMYTTLQQQAHTVLVSARQRNSDQAPPLERIRTALSNADVDAFVHFLPGRNLFLSKATFLQAGQFPEHLMTCEDYYFTDKVNELGKLFYTSATEYVHLGEDKAFIPMFKKEIWRGQSNLASLTGRKVPLRELPSFVVPLAVTGSFIIALVLLMLGMQPAAAAFLLLGLLPCIAYTARVKSIPNEQVSTFSCLLFYILYFPARTIGTLKGVFSHVTTDSHK